MQGLVSKIRNYCQSVWKVQPLNVHGRSAPTMDAGNQRVMTTGLELNL